MINRGAAIYRDKVYFTTLDAQLVALNKGTGKTVWRKKMEDYPPATRTRPPRSSSRAR